jgi:hypothetical protein
LPYFWGEGGTLGHDAWTLVLFVCLELQHEFDVLSHASDLKMKVQLFWPMNLQYNSADEQLCTTVESINCTLLCGDAVSPEKFPSNDDPFFCQPTSLHRPTFVQRHGPSLLATTPSAYSRVTIWTYPPKQTHHGM